MFISWSLFLRLPKCQTPAFIYVFQAHGDCTRGFPGDARRALPPNYNLHGNVYNLGAGVRVSAFERGNPLEPPPPPPPPPPSIYTIQHWGVSQGFPLLITAHTHNLQVASPALISNCNSALWGANGESPGESQVHPKMLNCNLI